MTRRKSKESRSTAGMIRRLKIRFVVLSMSALFVLLTVIVAGMSIINYTAVVSEADEVLELLSHNKGAFPDFGGGMEDRLPPHMSPELPYESRYFSVLLHRSGDVVYAETGRIASVDTETAIDYARAVLTQDAEAGFVEHFRFLRFSEGELTRVTFLDCGRQLSAVRRFIGTGIAMAALGFFVVFLVIFIVAGRIIRPIAESYEKQKRFITDAGHEIKTPLTIISANADVLEMEMGENESLTDIRRQTARLASLTEDLILLARMEEAENRMQKIDFPVSEVVEETALSFRTPARAKELELTVAVEPLLTMCGNAKAIGQLVSQLMDNAVKYAPPTGAVSLSLAKQAKALCLTVTNTVKEPLSPESLGRVFDRFWRDDPSRNSENGGYGIGLSVAKAIVHAHGGTIRADGDGRTFIMTVTLPVG